MDQIEKILKTHNRKGKRQLLVLWLRYHSEKDFYATFISHVSDPLYDDLNKTSDFWTKIYPAIKFEGKYEILGSFMIHKK